MLCTLNKIKEIQSLVGSKTCILECDDIVQLRTFYEKFGFIEFDKRPKSKKDSDSDSDFYVQYINYMKD